MTVKELRTFLNEHLVPSKQRRIGVMHFKDEGSACAGMKNELRKMMELMYGLTWAPEK